MAVVLAAELAYIFVKRKRRKKEMSLFRSRERNEEPLADKAFNTVMTAESISQSLARQGADTSEADGIIAEARASLERKDHARAIERAEAAKISLLRAKRDLDAPEPQVPEHEFEEAEDVVQPTRQSKPDSLPKNYMQAKFMLGKVRDLLDSKGVTAGEAFDLYSSGMALFDGQDYTGALSCASKAGQILDSETIVLIGGEAHEQAPTAENLDAGCPECGSGISADDAFCRECGHDLAASSECPGCGRDIEAADKFCRRCGAKLK